MAFRPAFGSKESKGHGARLCLSLAGLSLAGVLAVLGGCASQPPSPSELAVSSSQPLATQAGLRALEQGGNAFDAAIAVAGVLAVVEPYDASLGSSSFFLIRTETGDERFIDGGFAAPKDATAPPSANSAAAAAIPGEPATLLYISQHYAERPLEADLSDAIRLARSGFLPGRRYRRLAQRRLAALQQEGQPLLVQGNVPAPGKRLQEEQLADTLTRLANLQAQAFYGQQGAQLIARQARQLGARWTTADLKAYRVNERPPLRFRFGNNTLLAAPSTGGRALAQMLALANTQSVPASNDPVERIHHLTEVMRLAGHDSARHGQLELDQLVTPLHLKYLAAQIDPLKAHPLPPLPAIQQPRGDYATSFTVADSRGNRVVASLSLHHPFGCGKVLPGSGILLNDALRDARQAGRERLATDLTPVMLKTPSLELMTGSGGLAAFPDTLFLGLERVLSGMPVTQALSAPRYQAQLHPAGIVLEKAAADSGQRRALQARGYQLTTAVKPLGRLDWISQASRSRQLQAGSDPRGRGQGLVESN